MTRQEQLTDLDEIFKECSEGNWDGYNADPVSLLSYENTKRFINLLDEEFIEHLELCPYPDGEISVDWYKDRDNDLTICIGIDERCASAWLIDGKSGSCVLIFKDEISKTIKEKIRKVYDKKSTT